MDKRDRAPIGIIFLIVLSIRLYFSLTTSNFDPSAYFDVRMIEYIAEKNIPMTQDALFAGDRSIIFSPLFHYILAVFTWIFPLDLVLKILPQLFTACIPVIVYLIVKTITQKRSASILSAILASSIPLLYEEMYKVSPITLAAPLIFLILYVYIHVEKKLYDFQFVLLVAALSLVHPSAIILIGGLLGYLLISYLEGMTIEKGEIELILFSTFLYLWVQFLLYKRVFAEISLAKATNVNPLIAIGVVPLILGIMCIYTYLLREKNKQVYLYVSIAISTALFTITRLIPVNTGYIYGGIVLCILSGIAYAQFQEYLKKTKFAQYTRITNVLLYVIIIGTMVIPSIYSTSAAQERTVQEPLQEALLWLKENTPEETVVLATPEEGYIIASIAQRQIIADSTTLLVPDALQRIHSTDRIYSTQFPIEAISLLNEYDIEYILFSPAALRRYGISTLAYQNQDCVKQVFSKENVKVYRSRCQLSVI